MVLITRNREIDYRVDWYDVWDVGTRNDEILASLFLLLLCIGA